MTGCLASSTGTCMRDWRPAAPSETVDVKLWGSPDSPNGEVFEALAMAQTPQYEARARGVARLLHGRDILNVCGELNTVAHHENAFTLGPQPECLRRRVLRVRADPPDPRRGRSGDALDRDLEALASVDDAYGLMSIDGRADAGLPRQAAFRPARAVWRLHSLSRRQMPPTSTASSPGTMRAAAAAYSSTRRRAAVYTDRGRLGRRARRLHRPPLDRCGHGRHVSFASPSTD